MWLKVHLRNQQMKHQLVEDLTSDHWSIETKDLAGNLHLHFPPLPLRQKSHLIYILSLSLSLSNVNDYH